MAEGGVAGVHSKKEGLTALIAPSSGSGSNKIRMPLLPKACWKIEDFRFRFDSSFLLPEVAAEIPLLKDLIEEHTEQGIKPALSIFGHADPVGDEEYNKVLSGRRAIAMYGLLVRDSSLWETLYSQPQRGDDWGVRSVQIMLEAVGHPPGKIDGVSGPKTIEATKSFQVEGGLTQDGVAGPKTREKLFLAYMDVLCLPTFRLAKTDFLGRGADPGGKGDFQGCGEFNPLLLFSQTEEHLFSKPENKAKRDEENGPNRRVMIFLFAPGRTVDPDRWPCPRATEGKAGCEVQFFSDRAARAARGSARREFKDTHDTFACRFYHRFATNSPCEHPIPAPLGLGFLSVQIFFHQEPMEGIRVQFAHIDGGSVGKAIGDAIKTDADGVATLRKPVTLGPYDCQIEHQPAKRVDTVESPDEPVILVLPVGRPYWDLGSDVEFVADDD